jgi:hypothetical protein
MAQEFLGISYPAAKANIGKLVQAAILRESEDSVAAKVFVAIEIQDVAETEMGTD